MTETLSIIDAQAKEDAITRSQWVRLSDEDEEELQEYLEAEADDSEVSGPCFISKQKPRAQKSRVNLTHQLLA